MSCDSIAALPAATAGGETLFGKNSNRPVRECQRLVLLPRQRHAAGARVRCQYVDVPQAEETAQVLGSQPHWLWGLEHGVNEWGVAIGNHLVFAREAPAAVGLLGMDMVRLALERGRSASEAVEVITDLIETHGQGGTGYLDLDMPYNNSFLIVDRAEGFLLEAAGCHWAVRRVNDVGAASNHISLGTDWERLGPETAAHAERHGWSARGGQRFDFAAAYRDREAEPAGFSEGRHMRTTLLLSEGRGRMDIRGMREILRDHDGAQTFGGETPFTVCFHTEPFQNTTASAVITLGRDAGDLITYWACLGAPCVGVYLPYYLEGVLPEAVTHGHGVPDEGSAWWGFRSLLEIVSRDPARLAARVRGVWDALEDAVTARAEEIAGEARDLRERGGRVGDLLTAFMAKNAAQMMRRLGALREELRDG